VELFLLLMGFWFMIAVALGLRKARPDVSAARGVRARLDALYSQPHEFVTVAPSAFPDADIAFYDAARRELEKQGYQFIADIEDVTMSQVHASARTFMRIMVDAGGLVRGAIYHVHPRGMVVSVLQLVQVVPRNLRVVELVTEFDSMFMVTANTKNLDRLDCPSNIHIERLPQGTAVNKVVAAHQERITDYLRLYQDRSPRPATNYDEVLESMARSHVVMSRHRQSVGGLSRDELERMKGRSLTAYEEMFLREVQTTPSEFAKSGEKKPDEQDLSTSTVNGKT
jgi:hypothetical protein